MDKVRHGDMRKIPLAIKKKLGISHGVVCEKCGQLIRGKYAVVKTKTGHPRKHVSYMPYHKRCWRTLERWERLGR